MLKTEIVYRELLETKTERLSQLSLSKKFGFSLSTINNALKPLVAMGAVSILTRGLKVTDKEKVLLYWANVRNLSKDIVYFTHVSLSISEMEKSMPSNIVYTSYSGFKFKYNSVPADYSEIYVYAEDFQEIKKRFPIRKGPINLFVLKADNFLLALSKNNIAPPSQMFVDLWNASEWYAKEFVNSLREKIL